MSEARLAGDLAYDFVVTETLSQFGERLMSALDDSPIGTAIVGLDGRFLRVNHAFSQTMGYAPEELARLTIQAISHPDDTHVDVELRGKLARGDMLHYRRTKRYVRKDGATVFVRLNVSVLRDRQGPPMCLLVHAEDITEHVRAEEALRRSEANFRRLFEQASDGIFIVEPDGRCTDANPAVCEMFGYSREELVGKTVMDLVAPEDVPRVVQLRERLFAAGRSQIREWRGRRKDGVFIPVEVSSKFLEGREVAFVRDVSERKLAEREREESLRWLRAVLEQSPVGMILYHGVRGERAEVNSRFQQMMGVPYESIEQLHEMIRMPDGGLIADHDCAVVRALRGEPTFGTELLLLDARGGSTPVLVSSAPIVGTDGAVLGAVIAVQDITANKELERLRAEWSAVVAHDLRQPLGTISLSAHLMARFTDDSRLRVYLERIRSASQRLNRMVGDLMDLSRLDARRLELVRQRVDVPALVCAAVERMALGVSDRRFDVHVDGAVPDADADPDRVAQVVENLLTNAVKYGNGGTPIAVTIGRAGGEIAVAVTNEAYPIGPEELSRLFQRFQRNSSARLRGIEGTGLGLYITRSLVEAHGGHITAESSREGRVTFRFTLPVAGEDVARAAEACGSPLP